MKRSTENTDNLNYDKPIPVRDKPLPASDLETLAYARKPGYIPEGRERLNANILEKSKIELKTASMRSKMPIGALIDLLVDRHLDGLFE